jgi:dienelactone hydrolase
LEKKGRFTLRQRVQAAICTLQTVPQVDSDKLAVMGWCLGGHPVMEVAKLKNPAVRALATFHGVFDGIDVNVDADEMKDILSDTETTTLASRPPPTGATRIAEVLICNGVQDPFVSSNSLEQALALLQKFNYRTSLLQLVDAKHGFSNPAQDFYDNPSFAFQQEAAEKSWKQTLNMLQRTLF